MISLTDMVNKLYSPSTPWAINILFKSIKGVFPIKSDGLEATFWKMRVITIYDDESEEIIM